MWFMILNVVPLRQVLLTPPMKQPLLDFSQSAKLFYTPQTRHGGGLHCQSASSYLRISVSNFSHAWGICSPIYGCSEVTCRRDLRNFLMPWKKSMSNTLLANHLDILMQKNISQVARLFHAPTRTTSSGWFMLHRTVHALWNLYGNPYKNRAVKEEETVMWWGKS